MLFKDVAVQTNQTLLIHCKRSEVDNALINGLQLAFKGPADTDADDLPDAWEYKWFGTLTAECGTNDFDSDGLSNLREYQLGLNPASSNTDGDSLSDAFDSAAAWMEDATPQGGVKYTSGGDNWTWRTNWSSGGWGSGTVWPYSGQKMRVTANTTNTVHEHYFELATAVMRPRTGDVLYAYVNLDYSKPPSEVMLKWSERTDDGSYSWEHRAYWGADLINQGTNGTASRYRVGDLPALLQTTTNWVRLEVPASAVGLEGRIVEGMGFALYGGRVAWDQAGRLTPDMDGDGLPDWWELNYFGNLNQTGTGDYDGDGVTNLEEYQQGANPSLAINGHPQSQAAIEGTDVFFTVTANGTEPFSYQWRFNGTNLAGAAGSALTLTNVQTTQAGSYTVMVTNLSGTATSPNAVLTVLVPPTITEPTNQTVILGTDAAFCVTAAGTEPLSYQWRLNGTNLPEATSLCLALTNVQPSDAGDYSVVVTNVAGSVTSSNAVLTVLVPPAITVQPTNQAVNQSSNTTFNVTATGTAPLSYQWWFNGTNLLAGVTGAALALTNVQPPDAGDYSVVVTNVAGNVTSTNAVLTVITDSDGDGLLDLWEYHYFVDLSQVATNDYDSDGLSNLEEYQLGYDPTNAHTGGSQVTDADKDYDGDLLSNVAELRHYGSNPANKHFFNAVKNDAEYLFTAVIGDINSLARLSFPAFETNGGIQYILFTITNAFPTNAFDLYFVPNFLPYWEWRRIYSTVPGQTEITVVDPTPGAHEGYFVLLSAEDYDHDGLTDGYEAWFRYNTLGELTNSNPNLPDSNLDLMRDGWIAAHGLNPMDATGVNAPTYQLSGDPYNNLQKHTNYYADARGYNADYDPLKLTASPDVRPVITISSGSTSSFTITRDVGSNGSLSNALVVYYAIGGNSVYGRDYTINPQPRSQDYPCVFSVEIPAGQTSVGISVEPIPGTSPPGTNTLIMTLVPCGSVQ